MTIDRSAGNVADLLRAAAAEHGAGAALVTSERTVTWAELDRAADAGAADLAAAGLGRGQVVVLALPSGPALVTALFAAARAGVVAAAVDPSGADLPGIVGRTAAAAVIAARPGAIPPPTTLLPASRVADWFSRLVDPVAATSGGEDLVQLTRASSRARTVMLSHRAVLGAIAAITRAPRYRLRPDDRVVMVLPLHHVSGWARAFLPIAVAGASAVFPDRPDDVAVVLEAVRAHRVTVLPGAPWLYHRIAAVPGAERALASVRLMTSAASSLDPEDFAAVRALSGQGVWEGYGIGEACGTVTSALMSQTPRPGTVGSALPGMEVKVVGTDGEDLNAGEGPADAEPAGAEPTEEFVADLPEVGGVGRIAIRGPALFSGYWPDGDGAPDADGWFITDDVGYLDESGLLHLVDRADETITVAGFTVYPREVEDVLLTHPFVADAAVVSAPGPAGETVVALLVAKAGTRPTPDDLTEFLVDKLAPFKRPARFVLVTSLPHTEVGRLDRPAARRAHLPEGGVPGAEPGGPALTVVSRSGRPNGKPEGKPDSEPDGEPDGGPDEDAGSAPEGGASEPHPDLGPEAAAGLDTLGTRLPGTGGRARRSSGDSDEDLF